MTWFDGMRSRHPSEDRLMALALETPATTDRSEASRHVEQCARCASRFREITAFVGTVSTAVRIDADTLLTPDHLSAQRDRILRRLERMVGRHPSAKVLVFPGGARPTASAPMAVRRWLAIAAAAGAIVGITVGQFVRLVPNAGAPAVAVLRPSTTASNAFATQQVEGSDTEAPAVVDEVFLQQLELDLSLARIRISELRAFDELTPRAQEIALNIP